MMLHTVSFAETALVTAIPIGPAKKIYGFVIHMILDYTGLEIFVP